MLGKIVVAFCAFGIVFTAPTMDNDQPEIQAQVVRFENKSNRTGKYSVM